MIDTEDLCSLGTLGCANTFTSMVLFAQLLFSDVSVTCSYIRFAKASMTVSSETISVQRTEEFQKGF